jgi:hypothetical protein
MTTKSIAMLVAGLLLILGPARAIAAARVELELVMQDGFPPTAQQQWLRLLTDLKVDNLRIRKPGTDDKAEIKVAGNESNPIYRVSGTLTSNNEMVVPGGRFSSRDRAGIADWIKRLRENGPETAKGAKPTPFGLNAKQFATVHEELARPVDFATNDLPTAEAVTKIAEELGLPLTIGTAASAALKATEPVREDLKELSSGTALAYLLRPAGLVFQPRLDKKSKTIEYFVIVPTKGQTPWPVGWPPEAKPAELVPKLMEVLNEIEIDEKPLYGTMSVIGERLGTRMLYDHVALARQGLDPDEIKVTLNGKQWWYGKIIDKVLFQKKLKGEWRVDEAGKPLLWITTQINK